jgi:hypothetical protein
MFLNIVKIEKAVCRNYGSKPFIVYKNKDQRPQTTLDAVAYDAYLSKIRLQIRKDFAEETKNKDAASVKKFTEFRDKVVNYRLAKRDVSINNIKRHEEVQAAILDEKERQRRERGQRRINTEILKSQQRIYHLRKMVRESVNYITADTIDFVLNKQLNRSRVVTPTIFSDRIGILDEVEHQRLVVAGEKTSNPFPHHSPIMPRLAEFFDVNLIQYEKVENDKDDGVEWIPEGPSVYQTIKTKDMDK